MNLYVTPDEIKAAAPDLIRASTLKYDDPLYRRCVSVSRAIDRRCKRHFYPVQATRYFNGPGNGVLWLPDLISISAVALSANRGATYTLLDETDYYAAVSEDFDSPASINMVILNQNGQYTRFSRGQRSVRVTGEWGYTDDRVNCWEPSGITLTEPANDSVSTLAVSSVHQRDQYHLGTALQMGRLIKVENEMMLVVDVDTGEGVIGVVRGLNGSEAEAHAENEEIYLWRPPFDISQAAMISAVRDLARAQQGYVDTRGGLEVGGHMLWVGRWDPEAEEKMSRYIRTGVG